MWHYGCKDHWTVIENDECTICCNFEYHLRKTTTARRPDVTKNKTFFIDTACLSENNVDAEKNAEKLQKYQQLTFKTRESQSGYNEMKILLFFLFFCLIAIHSMQGRTDTTRHGITRKRNTKRLKHTGNLFRRNLQLIGVC